MKTCAQCNQEFQVFDEDREFYIKINVPEPTWCPECRNMRRCACRNERVLYVRSCDLCKKQTLSTHPGDVQFSVYCQSCWWSDNWDSMSFGREFDFSRPFFEQFDELSKSVPHLALVVKDMENSEYCNSAMGLKDSYLAIDSFFGERNFYTYWLGWAKDIVDSNYILHSELCYECQHVQKSYNCRFVYNCQNMTDSAFCFACSDCTNCFMCVNFRHKSYCIKNKQYTKEGYEQEMKKYQPGSYHGVEALKEEFWRFAQSEPRRYAFLKNTEDCTGDIISDSKNVHHGFDVFGHENTRYICDSGGGSDGNTRDSMDLLQSGLDCELLYETHDVGWSYNTHFLNRVWYGTSCEYCELCRDVQDCFGCFGLSKKQYCIFNKQYSKEEYESLRGKIIEHMKKTEEYGEFFPIQHSPYAYNETIAQQWYPKTREEVLANGWKWCEDLPGKYDPPTIEWSAVPDDIKDVSEDIIKNIFACQKCKKNYRIIKQEFAFYKAKTISLPRLCPDCRFYERFSHRNPRKLWHRQCMCDRAEHNHRAVVAPELQQRRTEAGKCSTTFETPYSPERPERIYCAECYEQEIL